MMTKIAILFTALLSFTPTAFASYPTGPANEVLVIGSTGAPAKAGQVDVSKFGVAVTGIGQVRNGMTGLSTITTNGIPYGAGTGPLGVTSAGTQYQVFQAGTSAVPAFDAVHLDQAVATTGLLPVNRGGTGQSTTLTPTYTVLTSNSGSSGVGTYTTPAGVSYLKFKFYGAGGAGGGGGNGTTVGATGSTGGNSTFGSTCLTVNGGGGGRGGPAAASGGAQGGAGQTATVGACTSQGTVTAIIAATGRDGDGGFGNITDAPGSAGCSSLLGGGGPLARSSGSSIASSNAAVPNTGSGGSGGPGDNASASAGGAGGGCGGILEGIITSPTGTYAYSLAAGPTGGAPGATGMTGGTGSGAIMIIEEHYTGGQ